VVKIRTQGRRRSSSRARWLVVAVPVAVGLAPAARTLAAATLEHLGLAGSSASVAPSCPGAPCEAITATTGFQAAIAGRHEAMVVQRPGRVTSWSLALAALSPAQVAFFTRLAHGPPAAGLVILHQGTSYRFRVVDASPLVPLSGLLGQTKTFDLARPLAVAPGDVVALTVPTWAPALAVALDPATGWRASRARGTCANVFKPTAQVAKGALTKYECVYHTARLTYGATVADDPGPTASPPGPRRPGAAPRKPPASAASVPRRR
jgi:hypothetical protein